MTPQAVRDFFESLSRGDVKDLEPVFHDDVVLEFPGARFGVRAEGKRKVMVFLRQNQRLFDGGLSFDVDWVGMMDDRAVATWTNRGRTKSGIDYANRGCTVFRFEAGRVVEIRDFLDTERIAETWPE